MMTIIKRLFQRLAPQIFNLSVRLRRFKIWLVLGTILAFGAFMFWLPVADQQATAQDFKQNTAAVTLDGRQIFKVSNSGEYTAKQRADIINSKLEEIVIWQVPIELDIKSENGLPTIFLNDEYLLTVTQGDAEVGTGTNQEEQAEIWVRKLKQSLKLAQKERSVQFLRKAFIRSAFILSLAIFCHWILGQFWRKSLRKFFKRFFAEPENTEDNKPKAHRSIDLFLSLTLASVRVGIWMATILYIANRFPFTRRLSFEVTGALIYTLTADIITVANRAYSLPDILFLFFFLWALIVSAKVVSDVLQSRILNVTGINRGAQELISITVRYGLISIGSIVLLQVWGLDLSSLTILASALGVGIGFGFQDIAKNFGSGIVLLFERPIQVGDFVEIGQYQGIVERVGARSTVIKTLDMVSIIVPNSRFLEMELINWDHDHPVSALRLPVGVAYASNVEMVRQSLLDVAKANPDILAMPSPQVLFKGFGESSLDFELRVWISQPSLNMIIRSNLYYQIEAIFRQRHIEIPFPQRDLHVRGSLPLELSSELKDLLDRLSKLENNGANNIDFHQKDLDSKKP